MSAVNSIQNCLTKQDSELELERMISAFDLIQTSYDEIKSSARRAEG